MKMYTDNNDKFQKLIDNLNAGEFERIGKFHIFLKGNGRIEVRDFLPPRYNVISDIPVDRLEIGLKQLKNDFNKMTNQSKLFSDFSLEKGVDFSLNFDYGGGSVTVCSEVDGVIIIDLKNLLQT